MEVTCTFQKLTGGVCASDSRYQREVVVPLASCEKDISSHIRSVGVRDVQSEVELILGRASIFKFPRDISAWTICPAHRSSLGIGWRRGANRCRVPEGISVHASKGKPRKASRGISMAESKAILRRTGLFVPVGSGMCRDCKPLVDDSEDHPSTPSTSISQVTEGIDKITLDKDYPAKSTPITPGGSFYVPSVEDSSDISFTTENLQSNPLESLNRYLVSRDVSPIRSQLHTPWEKASERTKRYYTRKAGQGVAAVVKDIAPVDTGPLYRTLCSSDMLRKQLLSDEDSEGEPVDKTLMEALAECYREADHWETRRQILSIMADKVRYRKLVQYIPGLTKYRFTEAKRHCFTYGRGAPVQSERSTRTDVSSSQIQHFVAFITSSHIIQDLPFGERSIKLSNKDTIKIPNVIRTMVPERIVKQYQAYCAESGFKPLSRSTLFRILAVCPASTRKSLQGLDYVTSAGAQAFEDLADVVERLGDAGQGMGWAKDMQVRLQAAKRYLKSDYKVHVSQSSTVADHCRVFALSDPNEKKCQKKCDHSHRDACDRCDQLVSAICEIESILNTQAGNLIPSINEELTFTVKQAKANIFAWKSHILRYIHQDLARVDVLETLDESSVLVVQDWAMKYLPRKYRESQTDWFGKRGIPWHISVAFRKVSNQLQMLTFVHIFQACSQDLYSVIAVMADVVKQLKNVMPNLKNVNYRQDNAGCYHSGATIICAGKIGKELGVNIKRLDFSHPQGGKGACDRKAATIKAHMQLYLNSGHDIETPAQMCEAMLSSGGIPSLSVTLCESVSVPAMPTYKLDGVSTIYNVEFKKKGMRVWKAYGVGSGQIRPEKCSSDNLPSVVILQSEPSEFSDAKRRAQAHQGQGTDKCTDEDQHAENSEKEPNVTSSDGNLFTCPEEGCTRTFVRHSSMMQHLDCGKHQRALERKTLFDEAALEYAEQLEGQATLLPQITGVSTKTSDVNGRPMGWALKSSGSKRTRFTEEQRCYLTAKFRLGEETGLKADPAAVARSMMCAKGPEGSLLFTSKDFLTAKQISGFFSRLAAKKTLKEDELLRKEDVEVAAHETQLEALIIEAGRELGQKHPIVYDNYNLCELASQKELNKFSLLVLNNICSSFGIDVSDIKGKRVKKPFINRLETLCQECECQQ